MVNPQIGPWALAIVLCVMSGVADAQGFIHASRVWRADRMVWPELLKSAGAFAAGIGSYWVSLRYMQRLAITAPEMQVTVCFAVTMIGVAIASGRFVR